jgi:aspartate aminotransferase
MYSSPPIHGGKIALRILSNPNLYSMWLEELGQVSGRINKMRIALADGLNAAGNGRNWDHIKSQIGMFSYTGISSAQVERMTTKWHIYMLKNGRISLAGLNEKNIEYVIQAFDDCVRNA